MLVFLYLNYYLFIPRLYFSQKYLLYVFAILLCFTLVLAMIVLADRQDFFRQPPSFSAIEHVHPNPPPSYNADSSQSFRTTQ
ncbi:MAG: hypothetical protein R2822_20585 [Spirosomataceae bacterium]